MVFRRKQRSRKRTRKNYRRKRSYKKVPRTITVAQTLPDKIRVKLSDVFTDSVSTTLADTFYEFAMNGCYDPYLGTGGGQPQGFDQWMSLYRQYRVKACKISVYYFNKENAGVTQVSIIPNWKGDSSIRTYFHPEQLQYCKYRRFASESGGGGHATGYINHYMSPAKIVGNKKAVDSDDDFFGTDSANPTSAGLCYWYVLVQDAINQNGTDLHGELTVKLTYYTEFYGRRVLADS